MSDIRSDTQNKNRGLLKNSSGITVTVKDAVVLGCMLIIFVAAIAAAVLVGTAGAAS